MVLLLAVVLSLQARSQTTNGSIEGTVTQSGSNTPIPQVTVSLGNTLSAVTDTNGHFKIENIQMGRYMLSVLRNGYAVPGARPSVSGAPINVGQLSVARQEHIQDLHLEMVSTGTISGKLFYPDGKPATSLGLQLLQARYPYGERSFKSASVVVSVTSDDRGQYRLFGLPPGDYFILAQAPENMQTASGDVMSTYFPKAVNPADAVPIRVESGKEIPNIDITLRAGHMSSVSGSFILPTPNSAFGSENTVRLVPHDPTGAVGVYPTCKGDSCGPTCILNSCNVRSPFTILQVPEGAYTLIVTATGRTADYVGKTDLTVGQLPVSGVTVTLHSGVDVHGHVTIRGESSRVTMDSIPIELRSFDEAGYDSNAHALRVSYAAMDAALTSRSTDNLNSDLAGARSTVDSNGMFTMPGIPPGRYHVIPRGIMGGYIMDVLQGEKSILNSGLIVGSEAPDPIEVILGTDSGTINGTVENAQHAGIGFSRVVLVPSPPSRQNFSRYVATTTDYKGRFVLANVPAGEYKLFAWSSAADGVWTNAEFMQKYEDQGTPVVVRADLTTEELRVAIIPILN